ncbi:OsmC family protein [Lentzea sp. BCCO 10_0856]|uniref:OsmC family protein n=1 Tax=Lentzea miocenica TaxID=3095431 RepID=A0ABU4T9R6_9PSEU|nr:OsmC family protein [Lentzea sp. BCCO 10_0856]MDX8034903.1 OsmC family protein [Lentzea sp. BCCO 10_0856]
MNVMPQRLTVQHVRDDEFVIRLRAHELHTDQPDSDRGPSPVELFVASLGTCVAHYSGTFLRRHHLPSDGLTVHAEYSMAADRPARVARIHVTVHVNATLTPQQKAALQAVANHCTVHNTLRQPPEIEIRVDEELP